MKGRKGGFNVVVVSLAIWKQLIESQQQQLAFDDAVDDVEWVLNQLNAESDVVRGQKRAVEADDGGSKTRSKRSVS